MEHVTLDLKVVSLNSMLHVEIILKNVLKKLKNTESFRPFWWGSLGYNQIQIWDSAWISGVILMFSKVGKHYLSPFLKK